MAGEFSEPFRDLVGEPHLSCPGARDLLLGVPLAQTW